jgi:pantoate--beta-alanine ligase
MGALHEGHLALARAAGQGGRFTLASVFVNPTQFGPGEDFSRYPRDLQGDANKLASVGVDAVFAPSPAEMYPPGDDTRVRVLELTAPLEGALRPGHFEGVATVVSKLLGIVGPCTAVFGRKDYQQLLVVRRMVADLFLPVTISSHPIVRDGDGLALSSRNAYLSAEERSRALSIVRGLDAAARSFARGERTRDALVGEVMGRISPVATRVDYVEIRDADRLVPAPDALGERAVILVAARFGTTRLLDNLVLGDDAPPLGPRSG